jgi:hypothetical protein
MQRPGLRLEALVLWSIAIENIDMVVNGHKTRRGKTSARVYMSSAK